MIEAFDSVKTLRLLPIAITQSSNSEGCVGALTTDGQWIRPQPILAEELTSQNAVFRYRYWTTVTIKPLITDESRPEDCVLVNAPSRGIYLSEDEWFEHFTLHCDRNVTTAFEGGRSLGLVEVKVHDVYVRPHLGNRQFIRLCFTDPAKNLYDWIVPEISFGQIVWSYVENKAIKQSFSTKLLEILSQVQVFIAIGLTLPNNRFPGKFRGCHPLVVGLHTIPDYHTLLNLSLPSHTMV